jgi:diguanylate cyclase (GGDEF)-like protein
VLGVSAEKLTSPTDRRSLGAATALIAIAIKNAQLFEQSQERGTRDSLTGCVNRAYANDALDRELRRIKRSGLPLSVLIFDVDHFKRINDRHGHLAGDRVLVEVARQLERTLRTTDIRCRYGGDEFVIILPETDAHGALQVAGYLLQAMRLIAVPAEPEPIVVTISVGVASASPGELDVSALLDRADQSLYRAKQAGRNRVALPVAVPSETGQPS